MSKYTSWHKYFDDTRLIYTYNLKLLHVCTFWSHEIFLTHLTDRRSVRMNAEVSETI